MFEIEFASGFLPVGSVGLLVKSTLLLALTTLVVATLRQSSAAKRHRVWVFGLGAAFVLPAFEIAVPDLPVSMPKPKFSQHAAEPNDRSTLPLSSQEKSKDISDQGDSKKAILGTPSDARPSSNMDLSERLASWNWPLFLLITWGLGVASSLLGLARSARAINRLGEAAVRITDPKWNESLQRAVERSGVDQAPLLLRSKSEVSPMVWGLRRSTLLLPSSSSDWSGERIDAVLAHELAHLKRRDPLVQLFACSTRALYWFHPLVWFAVRSLEQECERACDDRALELGSSASAYAAHLLAVTKRLHSRESAALASCMATSSKFRGRVRAILDPNRHREEVGMKYTTILTLCTIATVVSAAAFESAPAKSRKPSPGSSSFVQVGNSQPGGANIDYSRISGIIVSENGSRTTHAWSKNGRALEVTIEGEVELTDDYRDVAAISDDGIFILFDSRGRTDRTLSIEPDGAGGLAREYYIDDTRKAFDDDAARWVSEAMKALVDQTTAFAEQRVEQALASDGVEGALDLIESTESEHVVKTMTQLLLDGAPLPAEALLRIHDFTADFDSDHAQSSILRHPQNFAAKDPRVRRSVVKMVSRIDSDHEKRAIFEGALEDPELDDETVQLVLDIVSRFDSEHEASTLLEKLAFVRYRDVVPSEPFFDAAASIRSEHERIGIFKSLLTARAPEGTYLEVLSMSLDIKSDHERSELLRTILSDLEDPSSEMTRAFFTACRRVDSDHELVAILNRALQRDRLGTEFLKAGLSLVKQMDSDRSKAKLLTRVADLYSAEPDLREAFDAALDSITSEREYRRTREAISR